VGEQERAATAALGPPAARLAGDEAAALWQSLADLEETVGARLSFATAANTPAALGPMAAQPVASRLVFHAPAGRLHLFPAREQAAALVTAAAAHGFTPIGSRGLAEIDAAPAPQAGVVALRSRIRAALDPGAILALGGSWAAGAR
jgi:hypothetical protein